MLTNAQKISPLLARSFSRYLRHCKKYPNTETVAINLYKPPQNLIKSNYTQNAIRIFHTSQVQKAVPLAPILVKLMSPIARLFSILVGRRLRKWWKALPKKQKFLYRKKLKDHRYKLIGAAGLVGGLSTAYYQYHIEETPITGRRRFMLLNKEQIVKIIAAQSQLLSENLSKVRVPVSDPQYRRVFNVLKRIYEANDLKDTIEVNVIVDDQINAFVLADGKVFVFTGMLQACSSDHELAGILGHELSHAILGHSAEQLSRSGFFNVFSMILTTLVASILPSDGMSLLTTYIQGRIEDIIITLPYSRKLEKEADEVGMIFAARACYDVTQVPKFWERMDTNASESPEEQIDWLSTHPSHEKRVNWLYETLPRALEIHRGMNCPKMPSFYDAIRRFMY